MAEFCSANLQRSGTSDAAAAAPPVYISVAGYMVGCVVPVAAVSVPAVAAAVSISVAGYMVGGVVLLLLLLFLLMLLLLLVD